VRSVCRGRLGFVRCASGLALESCIFGSDDSCTILVKENLTKGSFEGAGNLLLNGIGEEWRVRWVD